MSEPFVGEIQAFAFGFAPVNWLPCDGRLVPVGSFTALFSLIGTAYGGNGITTFALPNLVGCVAVSQGQGPGLTPRSLGEQIGEPTVVIGQAEMPSHAHVLQLGDKAATNGTAGPTGGSNVAIDPVFIGFVAPPGNTTLSPTAVGLTGGSQPHANTQPTLAMIYCIATAGIFPSFG
jgi:microcystin-dependent protein